MRRFSPSKGPKESATAWLISTSKLSSCPNLLAGMMSFDSERRIKTEIAEIFASKNSQWIKTISMIVEVMYQQFIRECEESENTDRTLEKMTVIGGETTAPGRKPDMSRAA